MVEVPLVIQYPVIDQVMSSGDVDLQVDGLFPHQFVICQVNTLVAKFKIES